MSYELRLFFEGDAPVPLQLSLAELVLPFARKCVEPEARESLTAESLIVLPIAVASDSSLIKYSPKVIAGLENRSLGYVLISLRVRLEGKVVYRHPHLLQEALEEGLMAWLRQIEPLKPQAFALAVAGSEGHLHVRQTPAVEFSTEVSGNRPSRPPAFLIRPVAEPPLAELALPAASVAPLEGELELQLEPVESAIRVVLLDQAAEALKRALVFSTEVEEGGFLVGSVYRDAGAAETYVAVVTDVIPAEHTGASLLDFTLTGDSFEVVKRALHGERGPHARRLLGWYHTHLFPATRSFGLSGIDVRTHCTTFLKPWQIAGLVNIEGASAERVLRFYSRSGDRMLRCAQGRVQAAVWRAAQSAVIAGPSSERQQ